MANPSAISMEELRYYAERLPRASDTHVSRNGPYVKMARHNAMSPIDYSQTLGARQLHLDVLDFRLERGRLDGTTVWYWTYNGVIVRVDV